MAGFLDPQQQIIDMVLTGHGKMLLSQGELRFIYWAAYDDDVQYDLSGALVEDPLQREAALGYKMFGNLKLNDNINVNRALLSVPPGQEVIPTGSISYDRNSIGVQQRPILQEFTRVGPDGNPRDAYYSLNNMGVIRFNTTAMNVTMQYSKNSYPKNHKLEGFYVKVLASGTAGYIEQHHTLSDSSEIVLGADLMLSSTSYGG